MYIKQAYTENWMYYWSANIYQRRVYISGKSPTNNFHWMYAPGFVYVIITLWRVPQTQPSRRGWKSKAQWLYNKFCSTIQAKVVTFMTCINFRIVCFYCVKRGRKCGLGVWMLCLLWDTYCNKVIDMQKGWGRGGLLFWWVILWRTKSGLTD